LAVFRIFNWNSVGGLARADTLDFSAIILQYQS